MSDTLERQIETAQRQLRVLHLPATQAHSSRTSTRSVGTDPKDPSVFPLAKQKTLLCYERSKRPTSSSMSTHVHPRSSSGSRLSTSTPSNLPISSHARSFSGSQLYSEVACQTEHTPSQSSGFRH